jgi:hypothetical protein
MEAVSDALFREAVTMAVWALVTAPVTVTVMLVEPVSGGLAESVAVTVMV